ncbi:MAG TPA: helix-turn-helix transcriptional regulator [Trebonia sp.]|jgi:transcriptional regulator with XRE-family HTH domain|nr:helix-turn-helix transcriptional regulator [Trebonia sp.]
MSSPYVRRLRLGKEIRALRDDRNMTQARMARLAAMTRNNVSKLENGQAADLAEILNILEALSVGDEQWTTLEAIARDAVAPGWWDSVKHIGDRQALSANLEYGATTIRQYEQNYLPGLLQLPDYIRSLHAAAAVFESASGPVDGFLAGRMGRQRSLRRPSGPSLEVIVDELAVLRRVAPASAVKPQLRHLAKVAKGAQPNVSLRVLPVEAQPRDYAVPRNPFSIYTYPDPEDPAVIAIDTETADVIKTEDAAVARYEWLYERLCQVALSPEESAVLLTKAADMLPDS